MQSEAEKYDKEEESMQVLFTCLTGLEFPHTLDLFFRAVMFPLCLSLILCTSLLMYCIAVTPQ